MDSRPTGATYARHDPTETLLYGLVQRHAESFLRAAAEGGAAPLPKYVRDEFHGYLRCGVLACGFGRARCGGCGFDRLVAFSCKLRGLCPSCGQRRMAETAADLVDAVFPKAAVRQWVLSLPWELRLPVARDPALLTLLSRVFFEEVRRWLRARCAAVDGQKLEAGAVSCIQRFGGALNLNPHLHVLVIDGVFRCPTDGASPVFERVRAPTREDLAAVIARVIGRLQRARSRPAGERDDEAARDAGALVRCQQSGAGVGRFVKVGEAGINEQEAAQDKRFGTRGSVGLVAQSAGFNLHAGVVIAAEDRDGLERLCRYAARPAVALSRLTMLEGGQVAYRVKHERVKGKTHLVMEPMELMVRLAALIPPPRFPLVRYHGVLAPNSPWRAMVVPGPRVVAHTYEGCGAGAHNGQGGTTETTTRAAKVPPTSTRLDWATLLHRVWGIDALRCERCGGRLRFIAVIEQREVIDKILDHLGLPKDVPRTAPARAPPLDD